MIKYADEGISGTKWCYIDSYTFTGTEVILTLIITHKERFYIHSTMLI